MVDTLELQRMIWDWYQLPGNSVGGPLHIVTDDSNVDDSHLEFCRRELLEPSHWHAEHASIERSALGLQILDALAAMPVRARLRVTETGNPYASTRP